MSTSYVASKPSSAIPLKGLAGEILMPTFDDPIFAETAFATSTANLIRPATEPPHRGGGLLIDEPGLYVDALDRTEP